MAQLPPKIPNMPPIWQEFSKLTHHPYAAVALGAGNYNGNGNPSWADEFLDFSSARRGAHRRSMSDSAAFLEAPLLENCRGVAAVIPCYDGGNEGGEFDQFDDEQFVSMFPGEISPSVIIPTLSSSNPSSPSDHDCANEEKQGTAPQQQRQQLQQQILPKNEPEEVQSPFESDYQVTAAGDALNESTEGIIDPKRVKRILANRQSAQRSRVRKLQYISELERSVNTLQAEVSVLSPRVAFLDHQRLLLNVDNSALKQRMAALAQDKIFKDAHQEALNREIERLRLVYQQQNMLKTDDDEGSHDVDCSNGAASTVWGTQNSREEMT
ncbi:hypothetical protein MLD38_015830 [Melastoma candidum]|uniref:Uncharacterized protein n=1 Tax=Melastoma candidum TaxID=119954 RepID=A0ACB9RHM6_9MYRT|nr:hypothetical protein MLD38_015830 [Melastoma candidum]